MQPWGRRLRAFLEARAPATPVAHFRILVGVACLAFWLSEAVDLDLIWDARIGSVLYGIGFLAILCLMAGFQTQTASVVTFCCFVITHADPLTRSISSYMLHTCLFYLIFMPSGVARSLDARLGPARPDVPRWPVVLAVGHIGVTLFLAAFAKLTDPDWLASRGLFLALTHPRNPSLLRFLAGSPVVCAVANWIVILIELSFVFLIWIPRTRRIAIATYVVLMLGIALGTTAFLGALAWLAAVPLFFALRVLPGSQAPKVLFAFVPAHVMVTLLSTAASLIAWAGAPAFQASLGRIAPIRWYSTYACGVPNMKVYTGLGDLRCILVRILGRTASGRTVELWPPGPLEVRRFRSYRVGHSFIRPVYNLMRGGSLDSEWRAIDLACGMLARRHISEDPLTRIIVAARIASSPSGFSEWSHSAWHDALEVTLPVTGQSSVRWLDPPLSEFHR